ncbi:hypothetical protein P7K49_011485, partial [Saguinus oedipus]
SPPAENSRALCTQLEAQEKHGAGAGRRLEAPVGPQLPAGLSERPSAARALTVPGAT